jgi:hypothetical protein
MQPVDVCACVRVFLCARPLALNRAERGLLTGRRAGGQACRRAGGRAGDPTVEGGAVRLSGGVGKKLSAESEGRGDVCVSPNLNCSSAVKPAISAHAQVVAHTT